MTPLDLPPWLAALALLAATAWTGRLAWQRTDRRRLPLRLIASAAALAALGLLAFPVSCRVQRPPGEAILLTPGATPEQLETLGHLPAYRLAEDREAGIPETSATPIPAAGFLQQAMPHLARLHVVGHGLRPDQLRQLGPVATTLHPAPLPPGVMWLDAAQLLPRDALFRVEGRLAGLPAGESRLELIDPGGRRAEQTVFGPGEASFRLRLEVAADGRHLYRLRLSNAGGLLWEERLPLRVTPREPLQILLLQGSPGFEVRHLKNWLAEQGHAIAVRSTVSRGVRRTEFLNREATRLGRLDRDGWSQFRLLISDLQGLAELGSRERAALLESIRQDGLGVLALAGAREFRSSRRRLPEWFSAFEPGTFAREDEVRLQPLLEGWPEPPPLIAPPVQLDSPRILPLLRDRQERTLAGAVPLGSGRVAVTLLPETFVWRLRGSNDEYSALWTSLLNPLVTPVASAWSSPRRPEAFVGLPYEARLHASLPPEEGQVRSPSGSTTRLHWSRHPVEADSWWAAFWPRQPGWHRLEAAAAGPTEFYVHEDREWTALRAYGRTLETGRAALRPAGLPAEPPLSATPLSPLFPWLLFVAAVGTLWLETKW